MIVQMRTFSSLPAAFMLGAIVIVLSLATFTLAETDSSQSSRPQIFRTLEGPWSPCSPINSTQACYKSREVVCVRTTDNATAPWYYCTDIGLQRPHSLERCHSSSCPQDCAVTQWADWTPCNCMAGFFRSRRREIVLPPRNGGKECPSLLEREKCGICFLNRSFDVLPRSYTWRTGEWGACSTAILGSSADCGHGLQTRTVECVNTAGSVVNSTLCLLQEAYAHVHPPSTTKLCDVPRPCQFSDWTDWSSCTANCTITPPTGYRKRTRDVVRHATHGGTCSEPLEETRTCTLTTNTCPTYSWESSDWSPCQPQDSSEATCGTGLTNRFVYCIETRSDGVSAAVDSILCDNLQLEQPSILASCDIPCRQDCVVSPWSDWSECPKACTPTYSNRTRDVVLPPHAGGAVCPHLIEHRACPVLPCVSWLPEPYQQCFPSNLSTDCGWGIQSRDIKCQDFSGTTLDSKLPCSSLPVPPNYQDCYKPCSDDCVVSEWSDWSECSEMCDGIIGTQSRQRNFAALGTSCPYTEANLTETRNCSNPQPCAPEIYYIIEDPWGHCKEETDTSSSGDPNTLLQFTDSGSSTRCRIGLQNRTAVCMRGDNAVPPEECPIIYAPLLKRPCSLPCLSECQYTEWSAYSECSVTCGSGVKTRSRRLLQFADSSLSNSDCSVDGNGYQRDEMSCENPACPPSSEYVWYLSNYSNCVPFPSVLSQLSQPTLAGSPCGYGYQNRSVECRRISTGHKVNDELCLQAGFDRPSEVQSCEVACQDRCIVTEWSNYSLCDSLDMQTRTRKIIACSRYDPEDWEWCCPELSSLQLTETVTCERPSTDGYRLAGTSRYGDCIIDDPDLTCGNGDQYRSYECIDRQSNKFPEEFCPPSPSFASRRDCSIQCDANCQLSHWTEWGACSTSCGHGTRTRTRRITRHPDGVGRPCGPLEETDVCENSACPYAKYVPGPFSGCSLADSNSTCGMGTQTRQAICLIDSQASNDFECQTLGATVTFELSRGCELPCVGECVLSEWAEWSSCPTDCTPGGNCQHSRRRQVLRAENRRECMTVEYRSCQPEVQRYEWRAQNWTDCILSEIDQSAPNPNYYCGNGTQRRIIECVDMHSDSVVVHDRLCEDLDLQKPAGIQKCSVPCPIDCVVGRFSQWTTCPQSCDNSVQTRQRQVLVVPMHGGRMCPALEQVRPCPPNCTMYKFEIDEPPRCNVDYSRETQCGSALQAQPTRCRRNLEFVEVSKCLEALERGLFVDGLNRSIVHLITNPSYCSVSCPRDPACSFTVWSPLSSCVSSCYDQGNPFLFRPRALIRSFEQHTNRCLAEQYEVSDCPSLELGSNLTSNTTTALAPISDNGVSECVSFLWRFSDWYRNNTRDVWCESGAGVRVSGGCPESLKPLSKRFELPCASKECPLYSTCNSTSGLCHCSEGLEKVGGVCLPLSGCHEDSHCLVPNMQCDEEDGRCVCSSGYELQNGVCTALPTTAPPPTTARAETAEVSSDTTEGTITTTSVGTGDAAQLGILEIVLIGTVPLVIVIITVLILICITYRCRVYLEKQQAKTSKRRRANLSISSPSPLPHTAEEMMNRLSRRGAESASSGFVDDLDNELQKYGMAGKSFIASKHSDDVDEAVFSTPNHAPHPIPVAVAVPTIPGSNPLHHHVHMHDPHHNIVGESNLDGHMIHPHQQHLHHLPHQHITPGTPYTITDYPDGDFTTDVTYTTDEGSIVTTSVPPSSVGGSPNILRRGEEPLPHTHNMPPESPERHSGSRGTDNMYVDMQSQPVYASLRRSNHGNYQHHQPPHHVQHHHGRDYHSHSQPTDYRSVKAYERQSRERLERSHDQSREGSHDYLSEPDYARSLSPCSPTGRYAPAGFPPHSPSHVPVAGRDNRIATGLDNSIVRAAAQIDDQQSHHSQDEQEFQRSYHRSSGGRRSHRRRSGRRRSRHRHHGDGNPHHMTYHPSSRRDDYYYHHHDDYNQRPRVGRHYSEGDHDYDPRREHYYYHSDAQPSPSPHPQYHYQASRSVPMTPIMSNDGELTPHLPPSHHHPHSPAVVHRQPPHSPAVVQGHPPHSPAVIQGQPHYNSHELQQPNIDIQPPTPATSHRGDMTPRNSPYVHHQPPNMASHEQRQLQQVNPEQGGHSGYAPSSVYTPQSVSMPSLPGHMVPQSTTSVTATSTQVAAASNHVTPPVSGDSYDNYDFPRKVHAHYLMQEQLKQSADAADSSHYAYPRNVVTSNSTMSVPSPVASTSASYNYVSDNHHHHQPVTMGNHLQPQQASTPYSKSSTLHSDLSIASSVATNTTYTPQSVVGDSVTNSPPGSPYVVRRQHHHPSPLVLHSSSSNSPATSTVYTPRGSAEMQHQSLSLSDGGGGSGGGVPSSSFDSSTVAVVGTAGQSSSFDRSAMHQSHQHAQYQINHQVYSGGAPVTPTLQQQQAVQ